MKQTHHSREGEKRGHWVTRSHVAELRWRNVVCQPVDCVEGRRARWWKEQRTRRRIWSRWGKRPVSAQGKWEKMEEGVVVWSQRVYEETQRILKHENQRKGSRLRTMTKKKSLDLLFPNETEWERCQNELKRDYKNEAENMHRAKGTNLRLWALHKHGIWLPAKLKSGCWIQSVHVRSQSQPGHNVPPRRDPAGENINNMQDTLGSELHRARKLFFRLVASPSVVNSTLCYEEVAFWKPLCDRFVGLICFC